MDEDKGAMPIEPVMPEYKDRSAGLMVFGILTLLLGCLCALFVPLMIFGRLAAPAGSQAPFSAILPSMLVYGVLAVALIWLGIGSITAKRWARALLLIFSWSWLVMGIISCAFMILIMPKMMANISANAPANNPLPPGAAAAMAITMVIVFGFFFVALPAIWTFFYSSRHVKATCEARDPIVRWTDACPLPVLGLAAWLAFSAPMLLMTPLAGHGVTPFFGMFLTGIPGGLLCLVLAAVWAFSAWSLYKLRPIGWWIIFVAICCVMLSTSITFLNHDLIEMYRLMGYPESQIAQIQKTGLLAGKGFIWICLFWVAPLLLYLCYVRKYIFHKDETIRPLSA